MKKNGKTTSLKSSPSIEKIFGEHKFLTERSEPITALKKLTLTLGENFEIVKDFFRELQPLYHPNSEKSFHYLFHSKNESDFVIEQIIPLLVDADIIKKASISPMYIEFEVIKNIENYKYITYKWLEDYTYYIAKTLLNEIAVLLNVEYELCEGVLLFKENTPKTTYGELDNTFVIRFMNEDYLFIIECKNGPYFKNFKNFKDRIENLGFVNIENSLMVSLAITEEQEPQITSIYGYNITTIKNLKNKIKSMIVNALYKKFEALETKFTPKTNATKKISKKKSKVKAVTEAKTDSNIDDYYTADPTSYSYVRYLIDTTRIINLSRKELLTEAFEWKKAELKKAGDIKLAKNIYKIVKEAQNVFIVEYIIKYLCLGYSKNIDFLSDSKEMLLYYKIGIFSRVAKSYNEYATECYNRIMILNGKFVDIKNRDAYVGKDLNIPPPNHKERRSELAKKGLLKKAYKKLMQLR